MGNVTTTYDIMTRYLMQDQVSGGAQRMNRELHSAEAASHSLKTSLLKLAGAVGVGVGLYEIWHKTKEANMEMVNLQKRVTGTHFAFNQWGANVSTADRMKESIGFAAEMGDRLEGVARSLHLELNPVAEIYDSMAASAGKLGMSQEDTLAFVQKIAAATRVYGVDAGQAAWTISRALETGTLRGVDNFTKMLRAKLNLKEDGKGIGGLELVRRISGGLTGTIEASRMMGTGLEGTMADLHRESAALIRTLTGPAFKEVTNMLREWADYSAKNREHVEAMAREIGSGLVTTLTTVKDITIFLHDHWKALALIYAGFKIPGMVAGFSGGLAGALGGGAAGVGGAAAAGGAAGPWGAIIAASAAMLTGVIVDAVQRGNRQAKEDETMAATYGVGVKGGTIDALIGSYERFRSAKGDAEKNQQARLVMAFGKNQGISDAESLERAATFWSSEQRTRMASLLGQSAGDSSFASIRAGYGRSTAEDLRNAIDTSKLISLLEEWKPDRSGMGEGGFDYLPDRGFGNNINLPKPQKADVKVTINRIEVVSDDPDRFAFGLDELVQTAASRGGLTPGYMPPAWQRGG